MKKAVILGTFDGLHKGHRAVIAAAQGYDITAVTFTAPPKAFFSGSSELLMSFRDRKNGLLELGVSEVIAYRFEDIKDMSAEAFLDMLNERFSPARISCGFNYRFGKDAKGDTEMLRDYCEQKGIELKVAEPQCENGETVSSSLLRRMIAEGRVEEANREIFGGFSFTACVVDGDHRGRTIGFPTINQKYPSELVTLRFGVYKVLVDIDGTEYKGIANIGHRPTYETEEVFSETYILGFSGDLYGRALRVRPMAFLREERKFGSLDELTTAIRADVDSVL